MSTTSPNFNLLLASGTDVVNVTAHLANNFSSLDSIIAVAHTGSGALKPNLSVTGWTLVSPTISGTLSANTVVATTASFQTITATGGALTVNSLNIGTYALPSTIGTTAQVLTVSGANAVWVTPSGSGTGANAALSNLTTVAFNTSLNTGSGGFFTFDRVIATSGALTGITAFQATTGTFAGALLVSSNVTISGTATINAVNCTGGTITAGALSIGTYSLPSTIGTTNQVLSVTTGNAVWLNRPAATSAYFLAYMSSGATLSIASATNTSQVTGIWEEELDTVSIFDKTAASFPLTVTASGYYNLGASLSLSVSAGTRAAFFAYITKSSGAINYLFGNAHIQATGGINLQAAGSVVVQASSGDKFGITITNQDTNGLNVTSAGARDNIFFGYKIPDA